MSTIAKYCAGLVILAATTTAALAQTSGSSQCAQPQGGDQNLTRQLDRSNGVICPPQMDPGMNKAAPNEGTMPVVPPPGSPGGIPNVQPK